MTDTATPAAPETAAPATNASIDIADIQSVVAVIDYAADQGAFKGWEVINKVAGVRTRLAAFLTVVAEAQAAAEAAEAEAKAAEAAANGTAAPVDETEATDLAPGA